MAKGITVIPAVSVALRKGERLLLVRRGRPPSIGLYAFPGGRVEPGESSGDAARRELLEETGLSAGTLASHAVLDLPAPDPGTMYRLTVFVARHCGGDPVAGDDAADAAFYSLDEMARMPVAASVLAAAREILAAETPSCS